MSLENGRERKQNHYSRDVVDKDNHMMIRSVTSMEMSKADWMNMEKVEARSVSGQESKKCESTSVGTFTELPPPN
jgi:hypothetical protein